jgi:hypothetical protein
MKKSKSRLTPACRQAGFPSPQRLPAGRQEEGEGMRGFVNYFIYKIKII